MDANKPTPTADHITPDPDFANSPKSFPSKLNYGGGSSNHSRKVSGASIRSLRSEESKVSAYRGSQNSNGSSGVKHIRKRNGHQRAETESSMINTLEQTGMHLNSNTSIAEISETDYPATDIGKGKTFLRPRKNFHLDDVQEGSDQNDSADGVPRRVVSRTITPLPDIDAHRVKRESGPLFYEQSSEKVFK